MIACLPTSLNAIACALSLDVEARTIWRRVNSGNSIAKSMAVIPPMEPPMTAWSSETPRWSRRSFWAITMSRIVTNGNFVP
jgi:hypothetical protein